MGAHRANRTLAAAQAKRGRARSTPRSGCCQRWSRSRHPSCAARWPNSCEAELPSTSPAGRDAAEFLLSAAQRLERFDPRVARDTHLEALVAAVWASGPDGQELIRKAAEAARAAPPGDENPRTAHLLLDSLAIRLTEGYEAAAPALTRALAAVRNYDIGADDADGLLWLVGNRVAGILAVEAWDYETGRDLAERQVRVTRESGALVQLQFALNFLANNVVLTGDTPNRGGPDRGGTAVVDHDPRGAPRLQRSPVGGIPRRSGEGDPDDRGHDRHRNEGRSGKDDRLFPLRERRSAQRARTSCRGARLRPPSGRMGRPGLPDARGR